MVVDAPGSSIWHPPPGGPGRLPAIMRIMPGCRGAHPLENARANPASQAAQI